MVTMEDDSRWQFRPERDDPVTYDRQAIEYLVRQFNEPIELAIDTLRTERFVFETMQSLHAGNLDVELLYRQCIPAAGIAVRLNLATEDIARYLVLFATCQTLILNNVDRHLDLSSSYTLRDPKALLRDVHAVTCYAMAELYKGMGTAGPRAAAALREMATVSLCIVQSMYDNYANRFRADHLASPHLLLEGYQDPVRSRHLGSGFYSSSIRGLYAYFRLSPPPKMAEILLDMRRLRQRVDELSDIYEDTVTGLLTYPVARLLSMPAHHSHAVSLITHIWHRSRYLIASAGNDVGRSNSILMMDSVLVHMQADLTELLLASGVMVNCYREAEALWQNIRTGIRVHLDQAIAEVLRIVVDLKMAFLQRLSMAEWVDTPPGHTFDDIRSAITGKSHDEQ